MNISRRGLTLVEVIVLVVVLLVIAFLATPTISCGGRASNERNASTTLKTLSSAEADFRANDRDWNHVNDFWTANVSGLYTMTGAGVKGAEAHRTSDPSIRLIELSAAAADADGTFHPAGGENLPMSTFSAPGAKAGYWHAALRSDLSVGKGPEALYARDTKGSPPMGRVHHETRFGFVAFPDSPSAGKYAFIVNENNSVLRSPVTGPCRQGTETPPGLSNLPAVYRDWPDDAGRKAAWNMFD